MRAPSSLLERFEFFQPGDDAGKQRPLRKVDAVEAGLLDLRDEDYVCEGYLFVLV